ncbi:MAG: TonB-dependent receptor, partial [Bacteroidales bacterium]|nr:TonB-dependent receptor [Bacteroidales bacterium]
MKTKIFFLLLLMMAINKIFAETETESDKADITGKVSDAQTKLPVEYASVALYNIPDSSLVAGCITDENGIFRMARISEGIYKIEIRFLGYETLVINNLHVGKGSQTGELFLVPDLQALQGVEITAERSTVEYKIDKQIINASSGINASNGSAIDVLKQSPSVSVDNDDNVSLRGSTDFLLLINDKIVVSNRTDVLKQISSAQIETIEIITNPSARYDAAGASGIINIKTKRLSTTPMNGFINARVGLRNKYNGDVIFTNSYKNLNYQISGSILSHNNFSSSTNSLISSNFDSEGSVMNDVERIRKRFNADIHPQIEIKLGENTLLSTGLSWMRFEFHSLINSDYTHTINQASNYYISSDDFFLGANQLQGDILLRHDIDTNGHNIVFSANYLNWQGINDQDILQHYSTESFEKNDLQLNRRFYEDHYMNQWEFKTDYKLPLKQNINAEAGIHVNHRFFSADKSTTQLDIASNLWHENLL